jgi:hypothetical protein
VTSGGSSYPLTDFSEFSVANCKWQHFTDIHNIGFSLDIPHSIPNLGICLPGSG